MIIRKNKVEETRSNVFDEPGSVNAFGIKVLMDGTQWVIDSKSGEPIRREVCECMRTKTGIYFWFKKGEQITAMDNPKPSLWGIK